MPNHVAGVSLHLFARSRECESIAVVGPFFLEILFIDLRSQSIDKSRTPHCHRPSLLL